MKEKLIRLMQRVGVGIFIASFITLILRLSVVPDTFVAISLGVIIFLGLLQSNIMKIH